MVMLMGEFHHNLDAKGRIIVPAKIREDLGDSIIVTRGIEDCLFIYSESEWTKVVSKLNTLPFTKKDARSFNRMFLSGATNVEFDKQGRVTLPSPLISYSGLIKECVIVGVGDRLEVWAKEKWDSFVEESREELSDWAESLFESNFEE